MFESFRIKCTALLLIYCNDLQSNIALSGVPRVPQGPCESLDSFFLPHHLGPSGPWKTYGEHVALLALVALEVHEGAHSLETGASVDQPMRR